MVESRPIDPGGAFGAPHSRTYAHISGRTGSISVGGRAVNANTGISLERFVSGKLQYLGLRVMCCQTLAGSET